MTGPNYESPEMPNYDFTEMKARFGGPSEPEPVEPVRIDHVAEARKALHNSQGFYWSDDASEVQLNLLNAHAHATLALVEQSRIANLIDYAHGLDAQFNWADEHPGSFDESTRAEALERHDIVQCLIRDGLGLS